MSDTPENKKPIPDTAIKYEEFVSDVVSRIKLVCGYCGSPDWETAQFDNKRVKVVSCDLCHEIDAKGVARPILHS